MPEARTAAEQVAELNGARIDGVPVRRPRIGRAARVVKRSFDLVASVLGLIAIAPLLAAIALAIRLDSPGPVLFRQRRTGLGGQPFEMLKFRSMVDGAEQRQEELSHLNEADGVFKLREDPRVTRVGRVIRRYSLDELPQLVNVVKGEMSLVGPRPLPLHEDRRMARLRQARLELRPGITGPWQVIGPTRLPLAEMASLENRYASSWSLWADVRILLRTVPHVLGRRGI